MRNSCFKSCQLKREALVIDPCDHNQTYKSQKTYGSIFGILQRIVKTSLANAHITPLDIDGKNIPIVCALEGFKIPGTKFTLRGWCLKLLCGVAKHGLSQRKKRTSSRQLSTVCFAGLLGHRSTRCAVAIARQTRIRWWMDAHLSSEYRAETLTEYLVKVR